MEKKVLAYLENQLSVQEKADFEKEMHEKSSFANEVAEMKTALTSLKQLQQHRQWKSEIEGIAAQVARPATKKKLSLSFFMTMAATLLLLVLGLWLFWKPEFEMAQWHQERVQGAQEDLQVLYEKGDYEGFKQRAKQENIPETQPSLYVNVQLALGSIERKEQHTTQAFAYFQKAYQVMQSPENKAYLTENQQAEILYFLALLSYEKQDLAAAKKYLAEMQVFPTALQSKKVKDLQEKLK